MHIVTFYEVGPNAEYRLPDDSTVHARQVFEIINNAGAVDLMLLSKRTTHGGAMELNKSLAYLQRIGAIERRTVQVADSE